MSRARLAVAPFIVLWLVLVGSTPLFAAHVVGVQDAVLAGSDGGVDDNFGDGMAVDGDTIIVGAQLHDAGGANAGAAYVYVRDPGTGLWSQQAKLVASDLQANDRFGVAVAISGDRAIVGAFLEDTGATDAGAAYIFERDPGTGVWSQVQKIQATDRGASDRFGISVALEGDRALIGAQIDDGAATDSGSAYIFDRNGAGVWSQTQKLNPAAGAFQDQIGVKVVLQGDTAALGAQLADPAGASNAGAVVLFERDPTSGVWAEGQTLVASNASANSRFGLGLAIDGDTLLVGAPFESTQIERGGRAYVFERDPGTGVWTEQATIGSPKPGVGAMFGIALAMRGGRAAIGSQSQPPWLSNLYPAGAVFLFDRGGADWPFTGELPTAGGYFGAEVSFLSDDECAVAALRASGPLSPVERTGAAFVFSLVPDVDGDLTPDSADNCPSVANAEQLDANGDGVGDACDADGDGEPNATDNCMFLANAGQEDVDADGIGDDCDAINDLDVDADGVANVLDNCPFIANGDDEDSQADADGDGIGDACDITDGTDVDGDGVANVLDNCPFIANGDDEDIQADADGDGIGDACDITDGTDVDGDGVANVLDNCPFIANGDDEDSQADADSDGLGDACDDADGKDVDKDGVPNSADNCPFIANGDDEDSQADADSDGLGDACDDTDGTDVDGDGVANEADNCPFIANGAAEDDQVDADADGVGDACDDTDGNDLDGDGIANAGDNCPFAGNADQADGDGDGVGDTCDSTDGADVDGDGLANADDNCPFNANADQDDYDRNGLGDACDPRPTGCQSGPLGPSGMLLLLAMMAATRRRRENARGAD